MNLMMIKITKNVTKMKGNFALFTTSFQSFIRMNNLNFQLPSFILGISHWLKAWNLELLNSDWEIMLSKLNWPFLFVIKVI